MPYSGLRSFHPPKYRLDPAEMRSKRLPRHELLRLWTEYAEASDLTEGTVQQYRRDIGRFLDDEMVSAYDATFEHVHHYLSSKGRRGPARQQARQALRIFFAFLQATGRRADDPTAMLPKRRTPRKAPDFFTEEELCQLIYTAACWDQTWAWALVFIYATGLRVGEACSLNLGDIDLDAGVLTIRDTKNKYDRRVHVGPSALAAILALRNGNPTLLAATPAAIRARMKKLHLMTGLPAEKMHPHTLRHTCGTILSERGADQREIMEHLGHTDPKMTAYYTHVTSERAKGTARLL